MEEWKEYKLADVCSRLRSGKGIKSDSVLDAGPCPVIGGNGIRGYANESNFKGECAVIGRQGAYCGNVRFYEGEADLVEGIIAMPSQLFYSTGIPVSLWFLSRHKEQPGKVLFIDARNMGTMVTRAVRELMPEDITKIAETFDSYRNGTLADEAGYCAVKTLEDVKAQDFILTPGRYVGIAEQEDDGEPFDEKMKRLTSELSTLFTESHRLEDEIKKQLGSIGFEI